MAAQTIAAQVAELVGTTAPASLDDWAGDAVNRLYELLPYEVLAPYTTLESCNYGSGVSVSAVAQVSSVTPGGTFPIPVGVSATFVVTINSHACVGYGATAGTSLADITAALTGIINADAVVNPYVTASDQSTYVRLTAVTAGVEFSVTTAVSTTGDHTFDNSTVTANVEEVTAYTELTAKNKRIFEVSRRSTGLIHRLCREITPEEYIGEYADSNSMYYPTNYDPVWCKYTNTIKVLPADAGMIVYARTLSHVATQDTSQTAITTLPYDAEYLVVLDLASRTAMNKASLLSQSALTISAVAPTSPTLATVSYVNATGSTVSATTVGAVPSLLTFSNIPIPGMVLAASTAFDTAMASRDIELAQAQLGKVNQGLSDYQAKIQENVASFQKDLKKFEADMQKVIQQATITLQEAQENAKLATDVAMQNAIQTMAAIAQNNLSLLNKYERDVAVYAQKVQAETASYQSNLARMKGETERYMTLAMAFRQEYYEHLMTKFGIVFKGAGNGKQG